MSRPYGAQSKDVHLDGAAAASDSGRRAALEARDEAVRLLYVGVTRARDHLFLRRTSRPPAWLAVLDAGPEPQVVLPTEDGTPIIAGGVAHLARTQHLGPEPRSGKEPTSTLFLGVDRARVPHRPLRLRPSGSDGGSAPFEATARTELGGRLPIVGAPEMDLLGQAVHAFLAADAADRELQRRLARAGSVLERWNMTGHLSAESLVEAGDRLWSFLAGRFPGARLRREVPVCAPVGLQVIGGRIDLLVEQGDRFAIFDHKSFPGRPARGKPSRSAWDLNSTPTPEPSRA